MRLALSILAALTACYRPGAEAPCTVTCGAALECPAGLECNAAMNLCALIGGGCSVDAPPGTIDAPIDGPIDAEIDAGVPTVCGFNSVPTSTMLLAGDWYMAARNVPRAVMLNGGSVVVTENPDSTNTSDYTLVFPIILGPATFDVPRLAPSGNELFVMKLELDTLSIARSTRNTVNNMWSEPISLVVKKIDGSTDQTFTDSHAPSAPTTTNPRRMLVSSEAGLPLEEYMETSANRWQVVGTHPVMYGGVVVLGHALLTPDGLRMTFRGQPSVGGTLSGYYVERPVVGGPFSETAVQIPTADGLSVSAPYLTPDCRHYYFTDANGGVIRHVAYP